MTTTTDFLYIGIDPGVNGGIAWRVDGKTYAVKMPPTPVDIVNLLRQFQQTNRIVELFLEIPPLFAGRNIPGSAIAKLMGNAEGIYFAALSMGFKIHRVAPAAWLKAHPVGTKGKRTTTQWKNSLKARAGDLFPDGVPITLWSADALLILDAGIRGAIK